MFKSFGINLIVFIIIALAFVTFFCIFYKNIKYTPKESTLYTENTVTIGPKLNYGRSHHSSILLSNGNVLVIGGYETGGTCSKHPELYDYQKKSFRILPQTHKKHCKCSLIKRGDEKIVILDNKNIELFDPKTLLFTNYDKKLFEGKTIFNVLPLDQNNAILYTNNSVYTLNLYDFKLKKIFTQKNKIFRVITISENLMIILQNDYNQKQLLISNFNIKEKRVVYQKKLNFNCTNAINIDSANIIIVDTNNNIYVYNLEQKKVTKKAEFSIYEFYGIPQLLKLKNNKIFILHGLIQEYPFLSNKIFIYDNKFSESLQLNYTKQDFSNLVELQDGSILISGGQYDDPDDNSSDLIYLKTSQIYK